METFSFTHLQLKSTNHILLILNITFFNKNRIKQVVVIPWGVEGKPDIGGMGKPLGSNVPKLPLDP